MSKALSEPSNEKLGALDRLGALRDRLSGEEPAFKAAAQMEREAEAFCEKVRTELKAHRIALRLNQKELAERLELSQSAVSKLENGRGDVSLKMVFRIAAALAQTPVVTFVSAAAGGGEAPSNPEGEYAAAAAALAGAVQEDLVRRIPEIVQEAAARLTTAE